MIASFQETFRPTEEQRKKLKEFYNQIFEEQVKEKGCSTCKHCRHIKDYPGYVIAEENECVAGLECDTVLFSVKNCPKWEKCDRTDKE